MGIYDKNVDFDFSFDKMKMPLIGLGIIVGLLVLYMLYQSLYEVVKQKPIEVYFEKNPLRMNDQGFMKVKVTNITEKDAKDVIVTVRAKDKSNIQVDQVSKTNKIDLLEKGNHRELEFLINPTTDLLPGTYTLVITVAMNGQNYNYSTVLEVKP